MSLRGNGVQMTCLSTEQTVVLLRQDFCNPNVAMDRLFELFPDKYPTMRAESASHWTFQLGWPRHILEPIDPKLPEQARTCFGLELSELEGYAESRAHPRVPFVFSMFHSRALLAPALAMQMNGQLPRIVVHVDAHHDLSPSLLGPGERGTVVNRAFKVECRLDNPDTITQAIDTGFLNKANFLTAYVLATGPKRVFHIDPKCAPGRFSLKATAHPITLGNDVILQHAFEIEPASGSDWNLLELPGLPEMFERSTGDQVWLDVDLDAFCNRFDGDSDNREKEGSVDELKTTISGAEDFLHHLSQAEWLKDIAAVSVAVSPGFFPSEYWDTLVPVVCNGIMKLL